jgi:hypothetical protein
LSILYMETSQFQLLLDSVFLSLRMVTLRKRIIQSTETVSFGWNVGFTVVNNHVADRVCRNFPASYPQCVTSVLQWQHGSFNVTTNHTINTYPIEADGRMNLTNPCMSGGYWDGTAQYYYQPETYEGYTIDASGKLTLIRFDGQPLRPMTLISSDPIMWPMQLDAPKSSDGSFNSSFNVWLYLMFLVLSILYLLV